VRGPEPLSEWFLRERDENPDSQTVHYVLRNLDPRTWYQLEVTALNNIGWSEPNDLFCFRTAEGKYLVLQYLLCILHFDVDKINERVYLNDYHASINLFT